MTGTLHLKFRALRVSCACVAGVALGDVWPRVLVWLPAFYSGSWPIAGAGLLLIFAKRSRSPFLRFATFILIQEVTHSMCLLVCVRIKSFSSYQSEVLCFCSNFHKTKLKLSCSCHAKLSENWRAVSSFRNGAMFFSEIRVLLGCTTFSISFSCVMKLFLWKKTV